MIFPCVNAREGVLMLQGTENVPSEVKAQPSPAVYPNTLRADLASRLRQGNECMSRSREQIGAAVAVFGFLSAA